MEAARDFHPEERKQLPFSSVLWEFGDDDDVEELVFGLAEPLGATKSLTLGGILCELSDGENEVDVSDAQEPKSGILCELSDGAHDGKASDVVEGFSISSGDTPPPCKRRRCSGDASRSKVQRSPMPVCVFSTEDTDSWASTSVPTSPTLAPSMSSSSPPVDYKSMSVEQLREELLGQGGEHDKAFAIGWGHEELVTVLEEMDKIFMAAMEEFTL